MQSTSSVIAVRRCARFTGGACAISIGPSDIIAARFQDISRFSGDPKHVYWTPGQAARAVFWRHNSGVLPSLGLELAGFVIEYGPKGKPLVFVSTTAAFTWPHPALFHPGREHFSKGDLIATSNLAA
nr:hypothetical protein [Xanthomonas phaseoli]